MYCINFRRPLLEPEEMERPTQFDSKMDFSAVDNQYKQFHDDLDANRYRPPSALPDTQLGTFSEPPTSVQCIPGIEHLSVHRQRESHMKESRDSRRFQKELERAHRNINQNKERMKGTSKVEPSGNDTEEVEPLVGSDQLKSDAKMDLPMELEGSRSMLRKQNQRLKKELDRTNRILDSERSRRQGLKERLAELEGHVKNLRMAQPDMFGEERYRRRIRELESEVTSKQERLEEERSKRNKLRLELDAAKEENMKCNEKMRLLMFHHLPNTSARMMDIEPVNAQAQEFPGSRVQDYKLGQKLGEGHYGVVQVGTNVATGEEYAVKVLSKDRITRFKDLQQVAMEVHVLKKFSHPNIVHLQEVIHAPENLYLIAELCLMDLHRYHNEFGLSEERAKHIIFGVLKPLHHLHSHGICHLDVKPENILLSKSADLNNVTHEDIRLCDFGLVNMAKNPEHSKEIVRKGYACGTPGFFAPEMILKNEFEGRQADIWSLGCLVLELTLGFTKEWIESYEQAEDDPAAFRQGIEKCLEEVAPEHYPRHPALLDFVHLCLSIEPRRRIQSTEAITHPWLEELTRNGETRDDSVLSKLAKFNPSQFYTERSALVASAVLC